jgi:hypothetical protein
MNDMTNEKQKTLRSAAAKEEKARNDMYTFFKNNRASMPANITTQREFILAQLVAGADVADTYAQAIAQANLIVDHRVLPKHRIIQIIRSIKKAA